MIHACNKRVMCTMEFFSLSYMEELMQRLNSDQLFSGLRKSGRNATYSLHAEPEPESAVEKALIAGFSVVDGNVNQVWVGRNETTQFTDLVISGKYGVWVDLIHNRMILSKRFFPRN